jgi:hypothetical protein
MKTQILKVASIVLFAISTVLSSAQAAGPFGLDPSFRIGISGAVGNMSVDGTESIKDSLRKSTTTRKAFVALPSGFAEIQIGLVTIGVDVIPGTASFSSTGVLSGFNAVTNAGSTRVSGCRSAALCAGNAGNDTGTQKAGVDLSNHKMVYLQIALPMNENMYIKVGAMNMDVVTTETLATGSSYGNTDVDGVTAGIGLTGMLSDINLPGPGIGFPEGIFYKVEAAHTAYEKIRLDGSKDTDGQFNTIVADNIEGLKPCFWA